MKVQHISALMGLLELSVKKAHKDSQVDPSHTRLLRVKWRKLCFHLLKEVYRKVVETHEREPTR